MYISFKNQGGQRGQMSVQQRINAAQREVWHFALGFWEVISKPLECHARKNVFVYLGTLGYAR